MPISVSIFIKQKSIASAFRKSDCDLFLTPVEKGICNSYTSMFVIFIEFLIKVNVTHDQQAILLLLQLGKAIISLLLYTLSSLKAKNTPL